MDFEEHNKQVQEERQRRRDEASNDAAEVHARLLEHGMRLKRCKSSHYQLFYKDWIYNLYPGNQRIYADSKHRGPFMNVPKVWTLGDIADAVIAHAQKGRNKMSEPKSEQKCRVCGCTDTDCSECILAQGQPCAWVEDDLCSRCAEEGKKK